MHGLILKLVPSKFFMAECVFICSSIIYIELGISIKIFVILLYILNNEIEYLNV